MKELLKKYDDYSLSISATTRAPRAGETHGKEYFFLKKEEFDQLLKSAVCAHNEGEPVRAVSRDELLRTAWGSAAAYATRTVDVHVQRLRAKLGSDLITTVYRQGYCINPQALTRLAAAM